MNHSTIVQKPPDSKTLSITECGAKGPETGCIQAAGISLGNRRAFHLQKDVAAKSYGSFLPTLVWGQCWGNDTYSPLAWSWHSDITWAALQLLWEWCKLRNHNWFLGSPPPELGHRRGCDTETRSLTLCVCVNLEQQYLLVFLLGFLILKAESDGHFRLSSSWLHFRGAGLEAV